MHFERRSKMEYSIIQVALVFIVTFVAAIDQFNFL